ncbi:MAG: FecR domain-containing protein [Pseudomonadota bacterium]
MSDRKDPSDQIVEEATSWLVRLKSGAATLEDRDAHARWLNSSRSCEIAWQRLLKIERDFSSIPQADREIARATLETTRKRRGRRQTLKSIAWIAAGGGFAWAGSDMPVVQRLWRDHVTGTGEVSAFGLPDGTQISLNAETVLDIADTANGPKLSLKRGEVHIRTTAGPKGMLSVETAHGRFTPVGTRFLVRDLGPATRLSVIEGTVEVGRASAGQSPLQRVSAGQALRVAPNEIVQDPVFEQMDPAAWLDGLLDVRRMALGDVIAELAPHHPGYIHVVPEVADLAISGVFHLDAISDAFDAVEASVAVKVTRVTPFLILISAR